VLKLGACQKPDSRIDHPGFGATTITSATPPASGVVEEAPAGPDRAKGARRRASPKP
jgi:hypothetical protein